MPYIETEKVSQIRKALKEKFPEVKFSVTKEHYSSVHISIMKSKHAFENKNINHFWYRDHDHTDEEKKLISGILETVDSVEPRKIVSEDGDYGSIPNYYINLHVGKWNKPYQQVVA